MWRVYVPRPALKTLARSPEPDADAIWAALDEMKVEPLAGNTRRLRGGVTYRRRVRDYRIIFDLNPSIRLVQIKTIGRRTSTTYR
jgi:mRNA-degrading endonuclease RelE of RelBE toxin-antitoxin system